MKKNRIDSLLSILLKAYGIRLSEILIERELTVDPAYPSFLSVSNLLEKLNIKHTVCRMTSEQLTIDTPVLSMLNNGEFILITKTTKDTVYFINGYNKKCKKEKTAFDRMWKKVALCIDDVSGYHVLPLQSEDKEEITKKFVKVFATGFFIIAILLLLGTGILQMEQIDWKYLFLSLLYSSNVYLSFQLILLEEHENRSKFVQKVCKPGTFINCSKVTESEFAKIGAYISFAQVGFAYFVSNLIYLVGLFAFGISNLSGLFIWGVFALPVTLGLFFIQLFLIRKGCVLCCLTAISCWLSTGILYESYSDINLNTFISLVVLIFLLTGTYLIVSTTIDYRKLWEDNRKKQRRIYQFKYDYDFIQNHLSNEIYFPCEEQAGFDFGPEKAPWHITFFISLNCPHCGGAVRLFCRLLMIYPGLNYRLLFSVKEMDHHSLEMVSYLYGLYQANPAGFLDILSEWYLLEDKSLEHLKKLYPLPCTATISNKDTDALCLFSQKEKPLPTPSFFVNGRLLSGIYTVSDMYNVTRVLNYGAE